MTTPLRPGNVIEVINVLNLPFCPEGLLECLKRHRSVVIDSNKPAVIEHNPGSDWGSARVLSVGKARNQCDVIGNSLYTSARYARRWR